MPGWVIRNPRTRIAEVRGEVLEPELLGARAVADEERVAEREGVAGLEVRADAVLADVGRGEAVVRGTSPRAEPVSIRRCG